MSSLVRPEYGPTLAEIAGPRWPRLRLALLVVGTVLAVYLVFHWFVQPGSDRKVIVVRGPVAINVLRDGSLAKVTSQGSEELRLRGRGTNTRQTYTISPLALPAYVGADPGGVLPVFAEREIQRMQRDIPGFQLRGEGRTRINLYPGYAITYSGGKPGTDGFFYGKRIFLYPDAAPHPTQGVTIDMRSPRTVGVQYPDAVGLVNPLKLPLRSFNFGTERP